MDTLSRRRAAAAAEDLLNQLGIDDLPVDVFGIARMIDVPVREKPDARSGVSGALLKIGNDFAIAYATHVGSPGFQRFSVGHELGHLHIPGHAEALLPAGQAMHESRAGYRFDDMHEREADEFSANLLMPRHLFRPAMLRAGSGLSAILKLADLCGTSRLATAIRYVQLTSDAMAVVVSEGPTLRYAFLSDELKEFQDIDWPRRNSPLPVVPTAEFNRDPRNVIDCEEAEHDTPMGDWFGGDNSANLSEEIVGLGRYGRTLTVLTSDLTAEEDQAERQLEDSWNPRIHR
ncbi:MAG: ImmA/IrrE family metallo-endopeptidase [Gammaproteobacteria bacterium]|nr:ImmA/IrrE family metallo-endopeptidase [Gammaproteobacteria bacterium]